MKKVLVVIALVALAVLPVCAKANFFAVGLEAGFPAAGITVNYDVDQKWDGYATASFDYFNKDITVALGAQYQATELRVESTKLPVLVGLQVVPTIGFGAENQHFDIKGLATGALAYNFSIDDYDFTAYLRAGVGLGLRFGGKPYVAYGASIGCVYNF